ncbi:MAG: ABC transporter permease [Treponema sp.]|jgi:simple sugar transport system permease protein|nr:ABC transporter permease [Treponema sp.]
MAKLNLQGIMKSKVTSALIVLALLLLFNLFFTKNFFVITIRDGHLFGSLIDILNRGAPLMLLSMGMTLVIAATGGTDLSVGAIIAIIAAMVSRLIGGNLVMDAAGVQTYITETPMVLAIGLALLLAMGLGLWNGILVAYGKIQPIVATLVLMVAGRGIAQLITNGQIITIYYAPFFYLGGGWLLGLPFAIFIVAFVFIIAQVFTKKTSLGLFISSVGGNASASWYAGINEKAVKLFSFVFCGFCAGVAGLIICSNIKSADANNAGLNTELDAILAAVIGGTSMAGGKFSLAGSLVGALLIQTLTTTIYAFGVPPEVSLVVKSLVVVLVCFLQSSVAANFFGRLAQMRIKA